MALNMLLKIAAGLLFAGRVATGADGLAMQEAGVVRLAVATQAENRPQQDAQRIAEEILNVGSNLFDAKDAEALAATYAENCEVHLINKEGDRYRDEVKQGRAAIGQFYRDLFQNAGVIDSENTVELARMIAPDLLIIHGRFRANTGQNELPFVQMRVKKGDEWLIDKLWLFLIGKK